MKQEAKWLLDKIQGDGKLDVTEKKLLKKLSETSAKSLPESIKKLIS